MTTIIANVNIYYLYIESSLTTIFIITKVYKLKIHRYSKYKNFDDAVSKSELVIGNSELKVQLT